MKRIITICALISAFACSKEHNRTFKGIITESDNCCSSMEGGRIYKVNIVGSDSTVTTVLPAAYQLGDAIAFTMHTNDTPPAILCLAICTTPQLVKLSDVTRVE